MSKKIKLVAAIAAAGFAASASAAAEKGVNVTVGGVLDTQAGFTKQTNKYKYENADVAANKLEEGGIVNDAKVSVAASAKSHGMEYGALVVLNANTSPRDMIFTRSSSDYKYPVAHQTMMFVDSAFGRLEGGAYTGSYDAMKAGYISNATGGVNGDWLKWVSLGLEDSSDAAVTGNFIFNANLPTSSDPVVTANASKVTYYTPSFAGIKAGVTFVPDAARTGTTSTMKALGEELSQRNTYKNVVQGGLSYSHSMNKVAVKASVLGEAGEAKKLITGGHTYKRKDLRAWEAGMSLHYMGFGVGGSYGDWGKSGFNKTKDSTAYTGARNGRYWSASAGYENNHYDFTVGYFKSENGGFKLNSTAYNAGKGTVTTYSAGVSYKIHGFMPYAEYNHYDLKAKAYTGARNKGHVFLLGTKLVF